MNGIEQPFWVIVNKEIRDHVRSWRFIILLAIITLTCLGALYTSLTSMHEAVKSGDVEDTFFFLKLFTVSDVRNLQRTIPQPYIPLHSPEKPSPIRPQNVPMVYRPLK